MRTTIRYAFWATVLAGSALGQAGAAQDAGDIAIVCEDRDRLHRAPWPPAGLLREALPWLALNRESAFAEFLRQCTIVPAQPPSPEPQMPAAQPRPQTSPR